MQRALTLMLLSIAGCDEPAEISAPEPTVEDEAFAEELEAELPEAAPSSWPSEVGSLRDAIEAFESIDTCLESLGARTPTEVSEGIADLSYDGFFEDVCRSMEAVHDADVEACDALSVSSLARGCRRRLALFHGLPSACPEDRVTPGREPLCVAWAARDEGLCRAASGTERMRCAAVLSNDSARCPRARGGDRVRCEAEVERYAAALGEERRTSAATRRPAVLELRLASRSIEPDAPARGVRLVARACRQHVELGALRDGPAIGDAGAATFRLTLALPAALELPARLPLGATDAVLEVVTPERGSIDSRIGASGHVELTAFEPLRGGAIEGTIEGELTHLGEALAVRGRFSAFVRDLDPLDGACRARAGP